MNNKEAMRQLIALGREHTELKPHLRKVLSELEREATRVSVDPKIQALYKDWDEKMSAMDEYLDKYGYEFGDNRYQSRKLGNIIVRMANILSGDLGNHILRDREIPKSDLKKVERALRVFLKMSRAPNKPGTWWHKNRTHIQTILRTQTYPTRDDDDQRLSFDLQGFTVYNTIQAEGQELDDIHQIIEKSVKKMKASRIPVVPKLLYGPLNIVGKINKANWLAWYHPGRDDVAVKTRIQVGTEAIHSLIHELGHRWWHKFLEKDIKSRWRTHHTRLSFKKTDYPMPDVGEEIGIPFKGDKIYHVARVENDNYFIQEVEGSYVKGKDIRKFMRRRNFPTAYASTDHEEHFCESFAMYCMGTLPDEHVEAFELIVLGIEPAEEVVVPEIEENAEPETPEEYPLQMQDELRSFSKGLERLLKNALGAERSKTTMEISPPSLVTSLVVDMGAMSEYELEVAVHGSDYGRRKPKVVLNMTPPVFENNIEDLEIPILMGATPQELADQILKATEKYRLEFTGELDTMDYDEEALSNYRDRANRR